jgi:hypothetical protein
LAGFSSGDPAAASPQEIQLGQETGWVKAIALSNLRDSGYHTYPRGVQRQRKPNHHENEHTEIIGD